MNKIHIAIASTTSKPGDVAGNLKQIGELARRAGEDGVDVMLTPEMSASGYGPYPEVIATAETAGKGPIYDGLAKIASMSAAAIAAGFVEAHEGKKYLGHYVVRPDGKFIVQRKHRVTLAERPLMPGVELTPFDTSKGPPADPADPGQPKELRFNFFEIKGAKCAISICADGGISNLFEHLYKNNVDVLLAPSGAGGRRDQRVNTEQLYTKEGRELYHKWLEMTFFPGRTCINVMKYGLAFAAVNLCGYDGQKQYHMGHGMIITPMGEVPGFFHGIPNLDRQRPMYAHADVDLDERLKVR